MKNTRLGLLTVDALCAWLFSTGAGLVLCPILGFPILGFPEAPVFLALPVLLWLVLLALSERKPWVPPAVLAACGALVFGAVAFTGNAGNLAAFLADYIRAALADTLSGQPRFLVYFAFALPLALFFWVLLRWQRIPALAALWLLTLTAAGLIGWKACVQPEGWPAPFVLLLAGVILFLPWVSTARRPHAFCAERKMAADEKAKPFHPGDSSFGRIRAGGGLGRLQAQILAGILAVPVLGLAFLLGPGADGQWKSAGVQHLVQDSQDFWEYHWGELPPLPITSMRSMGLQPQKDRLGGDWDPNDQTAITANKDLLLRGQALDCYTGSGWTDNQDGNGNFRYDSLFWQGRKRDAFCLDTPLDLSKPLLDELLVEVHADLLCRRQFRSVFLPYRTETVKPQHDGELYFDMQGEAYWNRLPGQSIEYTVEALTWDIWDRDFDQNMRFLEAALSPADRDPLYEQALETCLQTPDSLPDWVGDLAADLTADLLTPYARAMALRDYLAENCQYTLTPGPTDPEMDFVAEFLTKRQGYCTYYASALTVLCRCAGIPARYVTGYGMVQDGRYYKATQATAHAWTEIYLENIGWVPLDALGRDIFQQEPPPQEAQSGNSMGGPPSTPSPEPYSGEGLLDFQPEEKGPNPLALCWLLILPAVFLAVLAAKYLRSRRYTPANVRRKFPQPDSAAEHCYAGLLRQLHVLGLTPKPGETLLRFWLRVSERLPEGTDWQEIGRIMDRLRFGGEAPSQEEAAWLCERCRELDGHIRAVKGILRWLLS